MYHCSLFNQYSGYTFVWTWQYCLCLSPVVTMNIYSINFIFLEVMNGLVLWELWFIYLGFSAPITNISIVYINIVNTFDTILWKIKHTSNLWVQYLHGAISYQTSLSTCSKLDGLLWRCPHNGHHYFSVSLSSMYFSHFLNLMFSLLLDLVSCFGKFYFLVGCTILEW